MPLRYQKRIGSKGLGVNLSKTGMSTSYRSPIGAIGTRGFSIRTGIPGLSFRQYNKKGDGFIMFFSILIMLTIGIAVLIIYNIFSFIFWCIRRLSNKYGDLEMVDEAEKDYSQEKQAITEKGEPLPLMYGEDYGIEIKGVDPLFMQVASIAVMLQKFSINIAKKHLGLYPDRTREIAKQLETYGILGKQKIDGIWSVLIVNEIQLAELIENIQSMQHK